MKTTDPRDSLDRKIDELLASQPAKAPADFSNRILQEIETCSAPMGQRPRSPILRFALPLAAALTVVFSVFALLYQEDSNSRGDASLATVDQPLDPLQTPAGSSPDILVDLEIQELLLLQDALAGFANSGIDEFNSDELSTTLETLNFISS